MGTRIGDLMSSFQFDGAAYSEKINTRYIACRCCVTAYPFEKQQLNCDVLCILVTELLNDLYPPMIERRSICSVELQDLVMSRRGQNLPLPLAGDFRSLSLIVSPPPRPK